MDTDNYDRSQRLILWTAYILHVLLIPAALGALVNALKIREYGKASTSKYLQHRDSAKLLVTHHQWLLRTFLISLFFMAMGAGTAYYGVGYFLGLGAAVWWIYRMVRGIVGYAERKPMPVA
jgi:uncharacterized membrane protein